MKGVLIQALLALSGLVAAYFVWTEKKVDGSQETGVAVVSCDKRDIAELRYEDEKLNIVLASTEAGLSVTETKYAPAPADPKKAAAAEAEGAKAEDAAPEAEEADAAAEAKRIEKEKNIFVANKAAETYLEKWDPLQAIRSLGELSEEQEASLELSDAKARLALKCGGVEKVFRIGGSAYGSGDRYLRAEDGGPVYLLEAETVRAIESAKFRFMQRELHRFEMRRVETLTIEAAGRSRTLLHRNRLDKAKAEWVDQAAPDRRNELFANWLERVERLRAQKYLAADATPETDVEKATGSPELLAKLVYKSVDGDTLGSFELMKVPAEMDIFYARTEATRGWVTVLRSVAQQVADDLAAVVGASESAEAPAPAPDAPAPAAAADKAEPAS